MIKTNSYVKYRSPQISDLINLKIFNKAFSKLKKIKFLKKKTKNKMSKIPTYIWKIFLKLRVFTYKSH